ncbi:Rv1733c family protein [Actinophytocola oryzae]|uniref:Transmembrane protein n=1 Tax=Actinophytocola oryzae TaxID=502181 RepID=A0A4R7V5K8_9PSEU|nr:hypothetical protein [Actinophytocola oryzae]TDV44094.1 hypothetical protein CLV71_1143 [Actinophytocola oryzae]
MKATPPSPFLRLVRLLRPGRNPLARGVDRIEGTTLLLLSLLALVLLPVMLTFGSLTYENLSAQQARQVRDRHQVVAVLTSHVPEETAGAPGYVAAGGAKVPARWRALNGTVHTGLVWADEGLRAGTEVRVWLDGSGRPTDPPLSTVDMAGAAVLVAGFGWLTAVGLLALSATGLHRLFERYRVRAWDDEWARTEPDWRQRSR